MYRNASGPHREVANVTYANPLPVSKSAFGTYGFSSANSLIVLKVFSVEELAKVVHRTEGEERGSFSWTEFALTLVCDRVRHYWHAEHCRSEMVNVSQGHARG